MQLQIKDLWVSVENEMILKGVSLEVNTDEVVALMGPNGSGKSTLAFVLAGHPKYKVERGQLLLDGKDITHAKPQERAKLGLFLSFQHPIEVSGVSVANFLRTAYNAKNGWSNNNANDATANKQLSVPAFMKLLEEKMALLKVDESFASRYLNEGFSGGEKKRGEMLQLAVLEPKIAVLDETDSGLDVDALKIITEGIKAVKQATNMGVLLITHYTRILEYLKPDKVVVMLNGKIAAAGEEALAAEIESKGYDWVREGAGMKSLKIVRETE